MCAATGAICSARQGPKELAAALRRKPVTEPATVGRGRAVTKRIPCDSETRGAARLSVRRIASGRLEQAIFPDDGLFCTYGRWMHFESDACELLGLTRG
jgi:hypothetical protein